MSFIRIEIFFSILDRRSYLFVLFRVLRVFRGHFLSVRDAAGKGEPRNTRIKTATRSIRNDLRLSNLTVLDPDDPNGAVLGIVEVFEEFLLA